MKPPPTKALAATAVVVFARGRRDCYSQRHDALPGRVHNGVITACVEPPTKGNKATSGDLNFLVCLKGARESLLEHQGAEGTSRRGGFEPRPWRGRDAQVRRSRRPCRPRRLGRFGPGPGRPGRSGRPPVRQDAPPPEYGVAAVEVTRGTSTATWGVYSTRLGSPVGDTTGGSFRLS